MDKLELVTGEFDWAESAAQELELIAAFIRSCPEIVRPCAVLADVVADAEEARNELAYFEECLEHDGAGNFEDADDEA